MNYPTEVFGDVVVVHTPEELNEDQASPFGVYVGGLEQKKIVLDLDNTETIDSVGLKALIDNQTRLRDEMGMLKIGIEEVRMLIIATSRQLAAADKQLIASHTQLIAADRQIIASSRQLIAEDRQLMATSRQRIANFGAQNRT